MFDFRSQFDNIFTQNMSEFKLFEFILQNNFRYILVRSRVHVWQIIHLEYE